MLPLDTLHPDERDTVLNKVYDCITERIDLATVHIPHSDAFYALEALSYKFPDREFTIEEVEQLLFEEYGWNKNKADYLITDEPKKPFVEKKKSDISYGPDAGTCEDTDEGEWPI